MRILLSAYHCNPLDGSEPGVGWAVAVAAAHNHEVWLLTHTEYRDRVRGAVEQHPEWPIHTHFLGDTFPHIFERAGYLRWQRQAATAARALHRDVRFDVLHHLTLSNNWLDCGIARVAGVPFVWGPVCGVPSPPLRYWRWFGPRGAAEEAVRVALGAAGRHLFGRAMARRASVLVGANPQSVERLPSRFSPLIHPVCGLDPADLPTPSGHHVAGPSRRAVFAGRLLPVKGLRLALAALRRPPASAWRLDVYGHGQEERAVRRLIDRWHLGERVRLHGNVDRRTVLAEIASADAFLFPSLHDCAPWVVGEAMALGCPVVGLEWGGTPTMLGDTGAGIVVPLRGDVVQGLADALGSLDRRTDPRLDFERGRLVDLVDSWYRLAAERGA